MYADSATTAVSGNSSRIASAASRPSVVCVGGMRMSTITRSGRNSRTSSSSSEAFPDWPTTSNPDRASSPARPSRMRTSSSATTTRVAIVLTATIMGYLDVMGTSAPPADQRNDDIELRRLAEEQAALRRVATLVASGAASTAVFEALARELAQVLQLPNAAVCRYDEGGETMTVVAVWGSRPHAFHPGSVWELDGPS